jgi:hypothetical protein
MSGIQVRVRELAGWGFDEYEFRSDTIDSEILSRAARLAGERPPFQEEDVLLELESAQLGEFLVRCATRPDLLVEMCGLSWSLGVVDLRPLIAFQRRLSFRELAPIPTPARGDWPGLLALSFGPNEPVECSVIKDAVARAVVMCTENPNLQCRFTGDPTVPLNISMGSPFFEVACLRDRWFLRDGYHRAYALLKAGVFEAPAVIVQARTIEELGATWPWFFSEEILFSARPPRVLDFLDDALVVEYDRPSLIKTLRITLEETLTLAPSLGEQS